MPKTIFLAVLLAASLATAALSAEAPRRIVLSESQSDASGLYGVVTDDIYEAVGYFNYLYEGEIYLTGTGTLIADRYVLTAAHLFDNATLTGVDTDPAPWRFVLGGTTYTVKTIHVYGAYDVYTPANDIAVVELSEAVSGIAPLPYNAGAIDEASVKACVMVGYGDSGSATKGIVEGLAGTLRAADNVMDEMGPYIVAASAFPAHTLLTDFDNHTTPSENASDLPGGGTLDPKEGTTAPGDSGGPLFMTDPVTGDLTVVGITSFGTTDGSTFGDIGVFTRVGDFSDFVAQVVDGSMDDDDADIVATQLSLNAASYRSGDTMILKASVRSSDFEVSRTDVALAVLLPNGSHVIMLQAKDFTVQDLSNIELMRLSLPSSLSAGAYQWMIVFSRPGSDLGDSRNWLATRTVDFTFAP